MLVAIAGFINVFFADAFVLDATLIIGDNPRVTGAAPLIDIFTTGYWGDVVTGDRLYRPLTLLTFRIEYIWLEFGDQPAFYAAVNLLLHVLVVLALAAWTRRLTGRPRAGLFAGLLLAAHPIATAVIPNLVGRADLLATLGCLLSLLAWERHRLSEKPWWGLAAAVLWGLALLAKESAAFLPAVILLREALDSDRTPPVAWLRRNGLTVTVTALVGLTWIGLRHQVVGSFDLTLPQAVMNPVALAEPGTRIMTGITLIGQYLGQAIWPAHLSADYSFNAQPVVETATAVRLWLAAAGLAVLIGAGVTARRHRPAIALGVGFFLLALLPVSNLLLVIGTIRADRLLYLPLVGLALAGGTALAYLQIRLPRRGRTALVAILALAVLAMAGRSLARNPDWADPAAASRALVQTAPDSVVARYARAEHLLNRGEIDRAILHADHGVTIAENFTGPPPLFAWTLAGRCRIRLATEAHRNGNPTLAERAIEQAREVLSDGYARLDRARRRQAVADPDAAALLIRTLAVAWIKSDQPERAIPLLQETLQYWPDDPNTMQLLDRAREMTADSPPPESD